MALNFQDVIRDVHDPANHALQISGTIQAAGQATVNINGSATLFAVVNTAAAGQASVVIDSSINSIGFATVRVGAGASFIGLVSIQGTVNLNTGTNGIGFVTARLGPSPQFIGLVTSVNGAGTQFIGLVTAVSRNAGTTKTLVPLPVGLGQNSIATIAVPTNANKINLTHLILSSNVTTKIAIKSGATYLTGNASLGVTLFPGGGFTLPGSPDSPSWIGLPSGAMVIEKRDAGGTVSEIGGGVIYFDE